MANARFPPRRPPTPLATQNTGISTSPETPFGGIKDSGWGKDSGKDVAVDEYLVNKCGTLTVEHHW